MTFPDADWTPSSGSNSTTSEGDIDAPIVIPRIPSAIAGALVTGGQEAAVERRWGLIEAVRPIENRVDLNLGGTIIESVARVASYIPYVGQLVRVDVVGTDIIVIGPIAPDYANQFAAERVGTVLAIATNGTLQVQFPDDTSIVTARRVVQYYPWLGDSVRVIQHLDDYLVLGSLATTATDHRRPTGDVEITFRSTAKVGTLFLQGQTLSRSTYARLWSHVLAEGGLSSGYGPGNGSSTFSVPDMRAAVPIGASPAAGGPENLVYALGSISGAATKAIAIANLPTHNHNVAVAAHVVHSHNVTVATHGTHDHNVTASSGTTGGHTHGYTTSSSGDHPGHMNFPITVASGGGATDVLVGPVNRGAHTHSGGTDNQGNHSHSVSVDAVAVSAGSHGVTEASAGPTTHSVTQDPVGSNTPLDVRQRSIAVNYMIWT